MIIIITTMMMMMMNNNNNCQICHPYSRSVNFRIWTSG
jgi:nitrate/TMAO reductase-like tetraheme cytochrome c subunit